MYLSFLMPLKGYSDISLWNPLIKLMADNWINKGVRSK